jgi:hypothetical protein
VCGDLINGILLKTGFTCKKRLGFEVISYKILKMPYLFKTG